MWRRAAGPASVRDRIVVAVGTVASLALGGCSSSTSPPPPPVSVALWVGGLGTTITGYTATQLASSTSAAPAVVLVTPSRVNAGIAFDAGGNLWVAGSLPSTVVEYTASERARSGSSRPNVTLTANADGSLANPVALAFDAGGNLWVANLSSNNSALVEFTASQLAASGSPTPAVTLSDNAGSLSVQEGGMAFDHSGNLWVSNGTNVVAFSGSQLSSSGSPVPTVTLSDNGHRSLIGPGSLAFDGGGNLWVASSVIDTVAEFAGSQLGTTGSPTPAVTLASTSNLQGLAFDGHGNLWVASVSTNTVLEFAASELIASGAPTPTVAISSASFAPLGLAFTP